MPLKSRLCIVHKIINKSLGSFAGWVLVLLSYKLNKERRGRDPRTVSKMANVSKKVITDKMLEKESKLYDEYKRYLEMFGEEHWLTQNAQARWSALFELVYIDLKLK